MIDIRTAIVDSHESTGVLQSLLPRDVIAVEVWNISHEYPVCMEEQRCVEFAVPKRRREFSAGRYCARIALKDFGIEGFPLLIGKDRSPDWPSGIIGSITHTGDYCGVAVGRRERFAGIGVDVEAVKHVAEILGSEQSGRWAQIFTVEEAGWLDTLPVNKRIDMMAVMFSAKEAFYKCQHSVSRQMLDFTAVSVRPDKEEFVVDLVEPNEVLGSAREYRGKFFLRRGFAMTAITMSIE